MNSKNLEYYKLLNEPVLLNYWQDSTASLEEKERINCTNFINYIKKNKSVGINLSMTNLLKVFDSKEYVNIFSLLPLNKIESRYKNPRGFKKNFFPRLIDFLNRFDDLKEIKYASLNTGNLGLAINSFGSGEIYLVIDNRHILESNDNRLLYALEKYSLFYYDKENNFLENEFTNEISNFKNIELLCFHKHFGKTSLSNTNSYNKIVASNIDVIEVLIKSKITLDKIKEIRIRKRIMDSYKNIDLISASEAKIITHKILKEVIEKCKELKIPLIEYER